MASCSTNRWVSTAPYVTLNVTVESETAADVTLKYVLTYTSQYAAETTVDKEYTIKINGSSVATGTYDITGKYAGSPYTIKSGTTVVQKGTTAKDIAFSVSFGFNIYWSSVYAGTLTASGSLSIGAKTKYTITYNANGGSGAPSSQTKWHGSTLTLSATKPSRTGYSFQGWATSASGSVVYAAGASYTSNANATLYAVWKANTYTVKYDANGGSGAPANQTKTYGKTLTLSSTKPTRTNYNFLGWATAASATKATYAAGGSYTANAGTTLYAVWSLAYVKPRIFSLVVGRCSSYGIIDDAGTYMSIRFNWKTDQTVLAITVAWESASGSKGTAAINASGTSGSVVNQVIGNGTLSTEETYSVTVTVKDSVDETSATTTLNGSVLPIDAKAGGDGVSFGKPAELGKAESLGGTGVADFAFDAKFNEPVYGKALGMDRLPAVPSGSDFNDYKDPGCYAVQSNAIAETCTNIPVNRAGRLEVWSSTGEGVRLEQWSYLRQRFVPYNSPNAVWEREITRSADNVWKYYDWWQTSLTPNAAKKVYHEQKLLWGGDMESGMYMTAGHTATLTEPVSAQPNGIVLVFSNYNSSTDTNYGWQTFFIPKLLVTLSGSGHIFDLSTRNFGNVGVKYLYIHDTEIVGHENNNASGTSTTTGITYANNRFVLRYVIGV